MLVTKKGPRLEKLPHRRGKCVSQQEGNRGAICSSSVKIPALGQDLAWFCLGESQGLRKLLTFYKLITVRRWDWTKLGSS